MTLEFVDMKWTVMSGASLRETTDAMLARVAMLQWQCLSMELTGLDGRELSGLSSWPEEVLGAMKFQKGDGDVHALFWNGQRVGACSKFVGGLYLAEYGLDVAEYASACRRALADVRELFSVPSVQCVVLSLEDDDEIDVAPGVMGAYRPELWERVSASISQTSSAAFHVEHGDWTVVCPLVDRDGPHWFRDIQESRRAALASVQVRASQLTRGRP